MLKKILLSFLAIILVVSGVMTFAVSRYSNGILSQDLMDAYKISAESTASHCNSYIVQVQNEMLDLAVDEAFQNAVRNIRVGDRVDSSALKLPARTFDIEVFPIAEGRVCQFDRDLYCIYDEELISYRWISDTIQRNGRINLSVVTKNNTVYMRISMQITDVDDWDTPIAILAADIQMDSFVVSIGKNALSPSDIMILVDDYGEIQYPYHKLASIPDDLPETIKSVSEYTENNRFYISAPVSRCDWTLVLSYSVTSIQSRTQSLYRMVFSVAVLSMVVSLILAVFMSYDNSRPIMELASHIRKKNYLEPIEIPKRLNKDYQSLYSNYNEMVNQINNLVAEVYETSKRERETQLKMLQAQLNPHFIYNVLDSINWLSFKYHADDIRLMVSSLATMLRCSLNHGSDILTVRLEITQIQSYLTIQSYRHDNEIHVEYDFADEIMEKKMIKLLLQPLVENAIIHGLETYDGEKRLRVSGKLKDDMLVFEVANNGLHPDFDKLQQIVEGNYQVTTSYGINNVNERIKAAYGDQFGLSFYEDGEWTVANITVPQEPSITLS